MVRVSENVFCPLADLCGDGEIEGRHARDDPVESSRPPNREAHKVHRLAGIKHSSKYLLLGAYPRQDVAVQMSLRNRCLSSATLPAAAIVPNVSVMSFSHLCLGFPRLLFPATIPCIIVFSKPLWRVTWPKYLSFCFIC